MGHGSSTERRTGQHAGTGVTHSNRPIVLVQEETPKNQYVGIPKNGLRDNGGGVWPAHFGAVLVALPILQSSQTAEIDLNHGTSNGI